MTSFNNKKVYIAPHTPKTVAFKKEFCANNNVEFKGFIDKVKEAENISKMYDVSEKDFDYILILSQNHFDSIYDDYKKKFTSTKLIKVDIIDGEYTYLDKQQIIQERIKKLGIRFKRVFLGFVTKFLDIIGYKREEILFISKSFIGTNNKVLYLQCIREGQRVRMLTDNMWQYDELKELNLPVTWLGSWKSYLYMGLARFIIQDQGNFTYELNLLSKEQKTIQLWHGIPLKRMNKLVGVTYDYLISTSDFVNETTLGKVIDAKEYKNFGYPRNDLLLKKELEKFDEVLCDTKLLNFAKENYGLSKIAVYMPTHRESTKSAKIPLDFDILNENLKQINTFLIVKLHPFVMQLYKSTKYENYSNIFFYNTQGDIYPLLRYCDILITDYSSIYYDFMLLERPIIFFDYDKDEYERNIGGFAYNYEEFTPGEKVKTQEELIKALIQKESSTCYSLNSLVNDYNDSCSAKRIYGLIYGDMR